ncbi:MAG: metalloregulator ArsR/SmtB family transcription factor [Chitinophagales bacterium]
METRRDVFQAIADPTRRAIIGMIAEQPARINSIAEQFDVSRQAISLHLKILSECGLLHIKQQGRERYCEANLEKLNEVHEWVQQYHLLWKNRLQALKKLLEQDTVSLSNNINKHSKKKSYGKQQQKK